MRYNRRYITEFPSRVNDPRHEGARLPGPGAGLDGQLPGVRWLVRPGEAPAGWLFTQGRNSEDFDMRGRRLWWVSALGLAVLLN